jgi:hypothetical protein
MDKFGVVDALLLSATVLCFVGMIACIVIIVVQALGLLVAGIIAGVIVVWLVLAFALYLIVEE